MKRLGLLFFYASIATIWGLWLYALALISP